jgi:hypothetical protein
MDYVIINPISLIFCRVEYLQDIRFKVGWLIDILQFRDI